MHEVSRAELGELQWKYVEMQRLRIADAANPGGDPRREMAALAERFPGSLRELDELPLAAIAARIEEIARCLAEGQLPAPWMLASVRFHQLMRGALAAKKWLGARRPVGSSLSRTFLENLGEVSRAEDARAWADDLERVARPPRGKLTALVFERLASELGISTGDARAHVLGSRGSRTR